MQQLGRGTVIGGHMGRFSATVLDNAIHYLGRLRDTVVAIHSAGEPWKADDPIVRIPIEACLAPNVQPPDFDSECTQRNMDVIAAQLVFALDTAIASRVENRRASCRIRGGTQV